MKTSLRILTACITLAGIAAIQAGCAGGPMAQSTGEMIDDAGITTKVKAAFVQDPLVKTFDVGVDTFKGTVQLNGWVDSAEQKARAEQIARSVPGVVGVNNAISIRGAQPANTQPGANPPPASTQP